ncbi:MAG TPA: hypothetical protein VNY06_03915, partial [Methylocella sp.]|nr:hypothetical protein [Methylocella sp.]
MDHAKVATPPPDEADALLEFDAPRDSSTWVRSLFSPVTTPRRASFGEMIRFNDGMNENHGQENRARIGTSDRSST